MKHYNLRQLKLSVLGLILLICRGISAVYAKEYAPMLVEGREWLFGYVNLGFNRNILPDNDLYKYTISKDTIVGGLTCKIVTYHHKPRNSNIWISRDTLIMREDEGILFQYSNGQFYVILDMNLDEGNTFKQPDYFSTLTVFRVDSVPVDGSLRKRILFNSDSHAYKWIEGAGFSTRDFFLAENIDGMSPNDGSSSRMAQILENGRELVNQNYFSRRNPESWTWNDNTWVYGGLDSTDNSAFKSYCRFGNRKLIGDFSYREFYEFRRVTWPDISNPQDSIVDEGGNIPPIYLRNHGDILFASLVEKNPEVEYSTEGFPFIYYFGDNFLGGITENKTISVIDNPAEGFNFRNYYQWFDYKEMEPVEIAGCLRRRYKVIAYSSEIECIEGIGITTMGYLPYIFRPFTVEEAEAPRLLEYCDAEGKVLHKFASMPWESSGVSSIQPDNESSDGPLYDLHGRKVTAPQRGAIYIRDGRKIVFR